MPFTSYNAPSSNYTYSWSPGGETTSSITVQPSTTTTYTVDVTSGTTTCQSDVTISVNQRDFVTVDSTACDSIQWDGNWLSSTDTYIDTLQNLAGCDSIVTLNLIINQSTSGTDVLTACDNLTWIDGITYTASNDTATHTLTNAAGCDSVVTLDLTINNSPVVDLGNDTNLCANTTIDLFAGNGFSYSWQDGSTDSTLLVSTTGTYDITITDTNGCTASDTINVNVLSPLSVVKDSTAVTCNGLSDGTASATVSGGLAPYTYLWLANGQNYTTPNATNLAAGTYSFVVTDSNGCSLTDSVVITQPLPLTASLPGPDSIADFNYFGEYNNQYIYYHAGLLPWDNARAKAQANGGDLIVISSQADQLFCESILPYNGWIGLYQEVNDPNYSEPSGGWKWVDGTEFKGQDNFFHRGEPNGMHERVLELWVWAGKYNDQFNFGPIDKSKLKLMKRIDYTLKLNSVFYFLLNDLIERITFKIICT